MRLIPVKPATPETAWLPRYLLAAVLIRGANDGAALGLVLLAVREYGPARGSPGVAAGGVLAGALTLPHVIGPLIGRLLDRGGDSRHTLAAGFALYGVALAAAAAMLGRLPFVLVVVAVLVAGCSGPLLSGGLSSRLGTPRSLALDSGTWGVATTAGPAAAGLLAVQAGPLVAVLVLCVLAFAAAAVTLTLPVDERKTQPRGKQEPVLRMFRRDQNLRKVAWCFTWAGMGTGVFPVMTPLLSTALGRSPGAGGLFLSAYGVGSLAGSLVVAARPLGTDPLRRAGWCVLVMGSCVAGAAVAPEYWVALVAFGLVGVANGPFIAAVLEVCRHSAPAELRAQVFVTSGSLKIGAASLAGAAAGVLAAGGGRVVLLGAAVTLSVAATTPLLAGRLQGRPRNSLPPRSGPREAEAVGRGPVRPSALITNLPCGRGPRRGGSRPTMRR
jgi:predicted MFS family arabinose efflux permease